MKKSMKSFNMASTQKKAVFHFEPKEQRSIYWGDNTRTQVKKTASAWINDIMHDTSRLPEIVGALLGPGDFHQKVFRRCLDYYYRQKCIIDKKQFNTLLKMSQSDDIENIELAVMTIQSLLNPEPK